MRIFGRMTTASVMATDAMISKSGTTLSCSLWCAAFLILSAGWASADDMAYAITTTNAPMQEFGTIDLNTGVFTPIASQNVSESTGLGVVNGKLYTADGDGGQLYEINPVDGSLTTIGTASGLSYNFFGSTITGLYAKVRGVLYSVDPGTGAATQIGSGPLPTRPRSIMRATRPARRSTTSTRSTLPAVRQLWWGAWGAPISTHWLQ
jgi:outer membrane protein assembly factor BamB